MADAILTAERLREVLHYTPETGVFTWRVKLSPRAMPGSVAGHNDRRHGYRQIRIDGALYVAHRLAWLHVYGVWPTQFIDHINGDRADCRMLNLREADITLNSQNRRKAKAGSESGFLGVSRNGRAGWAATISANKKRLHLGTFDSPEKAYAAYVQAKRIYHEGCTI